MSLIRTAYVPWFGSQPGSSQAEEPQQNQTVPGRTKPPPQGQRDKRGNKRSEARGEKTKSVLKVKLPKLNKKVTKKDRTPEGWGSEPAVNKTKTTVSRGAGALSVDSAPDSLGRDVFYFSQESINETKNEKEKAKLAVLRTISRVLQENQLIRQRLAALSQAQPQP